MKDRYDIAIEYFTEHPNEIARAWGNWTFHEHGRLFCFCTHDCRAQFYSAESGKDFGCPLMVRGGMYDAETPELTEAIRNDERIPKDTSDLRIETLPALAEWQRKLDIALDRK